MSIIRMNRRAISFCRGLEPGLRIAEPDSTSQHIKTEVVRVRGVHRNLRGTGRI